MFHNFRVSDSLDEAPGPSSLSTSLLTGLVAYWKLGEVTSATRVDSHGNNDLTDFNSVTQAVGIIGNAASFAKANSEYLNLSDNAEMSLASDESFTWCSWVRLASSGFFNGIVHKGTSTLREYQVYHDNGGLYAFLVGSGPSANTILGASTFGVAPLNTFTFIVAWHDAPANTINIQVNDGAVDSVAHVGGTVDSTGEFHIGTMENTSFFWDGRIDETGFWKRVLTSDERTELYNSGIGKTFPFA